MAKKKGLTDKQKVFSEEYLKDLDATKAAKRAGYAEASARQQASMMLRDNTEVKKEIQKKMDERSERTKIDADYVLTRFQDIVERCMQAEPVRDKEGFETGEWQFDAANANRGLENLGRHLKLFTDKIEVEGELSIAETMRKARERLKEK